MAAAHGYTNKPPAAGSRRENTATMAPSTRRQRRHALERPLDSAQILAGSVIGVSAATFYALSVRELPQYMQSTCALLFSAQLLIVVILFVLISSLDPAHPAVKRRQQLDASQQQKQRQTDDHHADAATAVLPSAFLDRPSPSRRIKCGQCRVFVSPGTRHCAICNKCVAGFDHHCAYLNTCIGARNYPLFIGLLSCTILLVTTQIVVTGFALARLHAPDRGGSSGATSRIAVLCCLSLLPLLQLVCMLVLAAFHLYLWLRGIRTHEFLQRWDRPRHRGSSSPGSAGGAASTRAATRAERLRDADAIAAGLRIHIVERNSDCSNATVNSTSSSNCEHEPAMDSELQQQPQQEEEADARESERLV